MSSGGGGAETPGACGGGNRLPDSICTENIMRKPYDPQANLVRFAKGETFHGCVYCGRFWIEGQMSKCSCSPGKFKHFTPSPEMIVKAVNDGEKTIILERAG